MKKNMFRVSILSVLFIIVCSCSDYLDKEPDDQLTLEMVFENKSNVEKWLAGIYNAIPDNYYAYHHTEAMGDDFAPSPRWEQFGFNIIAYQRGDWSPSSNWDPNYWNVLPKRIRSAQILIQNIKPLPDQYLTAEEVTYIKAEARFLIGYYHYLLLNYYGSIPIMDELLSEDVSGPAVMVSQKPFDEVVDWIDNEMYEASKILPPRYEEPKKYGRVTSIMCLAMRSRMLLFAASPLVNGNKDLKDVVNNEGETIFNSTFTQEKWERARKATKELIDAAHSNGHELHKEYLTDGTTIDPFLSYQNVMMKSVSEGNLEILMTRPDVDYGGYDYVSQPRGTGGAGAVGVTQSLVDAFFMKDGLSPIIGYDANELPILNPASSYSERGFSNKDEIRATRWKEVKGSTLQDENIVTLTGTYNMYCNREPRFYISVLYNGSWFNRANRLTNFYSGGEDGGPTHDAPQNGYLVRKKVDPDADPVNGRYKFRMGVLYRLAEAYLSYAEILNEIDYNGNLNEVCAYINMIRERAGIPGYGLGAGQITPPADLIAMRKAIHQERRVELNCENALRFDDVRRWKESERLEGNFWGMNFSGTKKSDDPTDDEAYFVRKVYQTRKFKSYWMPIPQSDIDKNPNLKQLPGW